jgi:hypothetical protein
MLMDRALEIAERATDATVERARGQVGALRKQVGRMTPKAWR